MSKGKVKIGLIGFGTIGTGVVRLIQENAGVLKSRLNAELVLARIADIDLKRKREVKVSPKILTNRVEDILADPEIDIVVELMGGIEPARRFVLEAIRRGKSVVTANKALLATAGDEIFRAAEKNRVSVGFEASVGGGIPIIRALREAYAGDKIRSLLGIINGTSNYILSKMTDEGSKFELVLKRAQERGYAEADPTLDVEGIDAAHKLAILIALAFGVRIKLDQIYTEGITRISPLDVEFAREFGYRIKLLAIAKDQGKKGIEARVHPTLIRAESLLAEVKDVFNAIYVVGEALGPNLLYGRGAGMMPTATAVLSDIVSIAREKLSGLSAGIPGRTLSEAQIKDVRVRDINEISMGYYLRFSVLDRPGVLSRITGVLGRHNISIASFLQRGRMAGSKVPIFLLTHEALEKNLRMAIAVIDRMDVILEPTRFIRIEQNLE
ncbi:MAG: homoserine dehydrogenase [Proteobacteria bacterium]|nr:homoserine dehydrogenase [Pseudomonadota bacterium]